MLGEREGAFDGISEGERDGVREGTLDGVSEGEVGAKEGVLDGADDVSGAFCSSFLPESASLDIQSAPCRPMSIIR